jgi:hypothetical protein
LNYLESQEIEKLKRLAQLYQTDLTTLVEFITDSNQEEIVLDEYAPVISRVYAS